MATSSGQVARKGKVFLKLYYSAVEELGLAPGAMLSLVYSQCTLARGVYYLTHETAAETLGVNEKTVRRTLTKLVGSGYINDLDPGQRNKPHRYEVTPEGILLLTRNRTQWLEADGEVKRSGAVGDGKLYGLPELEQEDDSSDILTGQEDDSTRKMRNDSTRKMRNDSTRKMRYEEILGDSIYISANALKASPVGKGQSLLALVVDRLEGLSLPDESLKLTKAQRSKIEQELERLLGKYRDFEILALIVSGVTRKENPITELSSFASWLPKITNIHPQILAKARDSKKVQELTKLAGTKDAWAAFRPSVN